MRNFILAVVSLFLVASVASADQTSEIFLRNTAGNFGQWLIETDPSFAVAMGKTDKFNFVHKFGYNPEIDGTQTEDVWGAGGNILLLSTATTIKVVSDAATDSVGLAGADSLTIEGLDASYLEQTETIAIHGDGTTTFPATTGTFIAVNRAFVANAGANNKNDGNLTIFADVSDTSPDSIVAYIIADEAQTVQAVYTVPSDYDHAFITDYFASVGRAGGGTATTADVKLMVRDAGSEVFKVKDVAALTDHSQAIPFRFPLRVAPQSVIKVLAVSGTANSVVSATFDVLLYDADGTKGYSVTPNME